MDPKGQQVFIWGKLGIWGMKTIDTGVPLPGRRAAPARSFRGAESEEDRGATRTLFSVPQAVGSRA